jgi:glycosyltransferase involved in cell wall biosynthesis
MPNIKSTRLTPSSISIIVPVYNSEATLDELTTRIKAVLAPVVEHFEIILVNDGSQDSSWKVITRLSEQNEIIRGLNLMHNYGQHNALLAGIQGAQYEIIVTIDDDLQHPPEEIPRLIPPTRALSPLVPYEKELSKHGKIKISMTDNTPHLIGRVKMMADGTEVIASEIGQSGCLVYGPYWQLPKGKYRVTFTLRAGKTGNDKASTLKITKFNDFTEEISVIGAKEIIGDTPGDWQRYSMDFEVKRFSESNFYEFLVNSNGQGELLVRDIELEKLS